MRSSRRGNLLLRNPLARGECAVRILFYYIEESNTPQGLPLRHSPNIRASAAAWLIARENKNKKLKSAAAPVRYSK